jgi:hypothetical protein
VKLVSGPAAVSTVSVTLSREERDEILARVQGVRSSAPPAEPQRAVVSEVITSPVGSRCCNSALSEQAHAQHWKFCPSCGSAIES